MRIIPNYNVYKEEKRDLEKIHGGLQERTVRGSIEKTESSKEFKEDIMVEATIYIKGGVKGNEKFLVQIGVFFGNI